MPKLAGCAKYGAALVFALVCMRRPNVRSQHAAICAAYARACPPRLIENAKENGRRSDSVNLVSACSSDARFCAAMCDMFASALLTSRAPNRIQLFAFAPADQHALIRERLRDSSLARVRLEVAPIPEELQAAGIAARGGRAKELSSHTNFARFFAHNILDANASKFAYVDADVRFLLPFEVTYDAALTSGQPIALKRFRCSEHDSQCLRQFLNGGLLDHRLRGLTDLTNAGMFVADLSFWRRHRVGEQLMSWAALNSRIPLFVGGSQPPFWFVFGTYCEDLPIFENVPLQTLQACRPITFYHCVRSFHMTGTHADKRRGISSALRPLFERLERAVPRKPGSDPMFDWAP